MTTTGAPMKKGGLRRPSSLSHCYRFLLFFFAAFFALRFLAICFSPYE